MGTELVDVNLQDSRCTRTASVRSVFTYELVTNFQVERGSPIRRL